MKRAIIVDSTANLDKELIEHPDVFQIDLLVSFDGEKKAYTDTQDTDEIMEFYKKMRESDELPKTSQASPHDFMEVYTKVYEQGYDSAIAIFLSSKISGTLQSAELRAKEFKEKLKIYVIDSKTTGPNLKNMVQHVLKWYGKDESTQTILEKLNILIKKSALFAAVYDLSNIIKGGRVNQHIGNFAQAIKLGGVINFQNGALSINKISRGKKKVIKEMEKSFDRLIQDIDFDYEISIVYTGSDEDAQAKFPVIRERYPQAKDVFTDNVTIVLGTHIGEHVLGFCMLPIID